MDSRHTSEKNRCGNDCAEVQPYACLYAAAKGAGAHWSIKHTDELGNSVLRFSLANRINLSEAMGRPHKAACRLSGISGSNMKPVTGETQLFNEPYRVSAHWSFLFIALIAAAACSLGPYFVGVVPKLLASKLPFREPFNAHALGWRDGGFPGYPLAHRGLMRSQLFSRLHLPAQVAYGLLDRLDDVIHSASVSAMPMRTQAFSTCIADKYR